MKLPINKLVNNTGQIKGVPANPRQINKDDYQKLIKSLQEDSEFMEHKPLHVYKQGEKYIVLGGNMRLRALRELGWKEVPVTIYKPETPVEVLRSRVVIDNSNYGLYDYEMLANEWTDYDLDGWGVDLSKYNNVDIDFDDIEGNADRGASKKVHTIECPHCNKPFEVVL